VSADTNSAPAKQHTISSATTEPGEHSADRCMLACRFPNNERAALPHVVVRLCILRRMPNGWRSDEQQDDMTAWG